MSTDYLKKDGVTCSEGEQKLLTQYKYTVGVRFAVVKKNRAVCSLSYSALI